MIDRSFHNIILHGRYADAGYAYGKQCTHLFEPARLDSFLSSMMQLNRTEPIGLARNSDRWCATLPVHYQEQIDAMASGAGVDVSLVKKFLYADIAASTRPHSENNKGDKNQTTTAESITDTHRQDQLSVIAADEYGLDQHNNQFQEHNSLINQRGPMCSGLMIEQAGEPWVARNCDWYLATLSRGTAAIHHAIPGRIPCTAVGLMGDIDADTGMNSAGLWLHMHTLLVHDEPRAGSSCISWLFWMREALETCETIADVERFIASTSRDRGVLLFAAQGPMRERAIFECSRSGYTRVDPWDVGTQSVLLATNHCKHKHPVRESSRCNTTTFNGTISRYDRLIELVQHAFPEDCPDDLAEILADSRIEMRDGTGSEYLRTIYSAVAAPGKHTIWFASGDAPAASLGVWRKIVLGKV